MRSTRASVRAAIQRISSGTSVPSPRTWRIIGPRRTVSIQTPTRSTMGIAGRSREKTTPAAASASNARPGQQPPAALAALGDAAANGSRPCRRRSG